MLGLPVTKETLGSSFPSSIRPLTLCRGPIPCAFLYRILQLLCSGMTRFSRGKPRVKRPGCGPLAPQSEQRAACKAPLPQPTHSSYRPAWPRTEDPKQVVPEVTAPAWDLAPERHDPQVHIPAWDRGPKMHGPQQRETAVGFEPGVLGTRAQA